MDKRYEPKEVEDKWQSSWESNEVFKANPTNEGEPFCVMLPPPNVTGSLHMGHAFESTLIDVLVRYKRMKGFNTLWLPGTDHASIAVQSILDKQLAIEGTTKEELGRSKFLERAWEWKEQSGSTITNQLRKLGVSVDWTRERFTLDEGLSKAVYEAFYRLHDEGLIYKGKYMVNWCTATQSAISDLEVEQQEVEGYLYYINYPLVEERDSYITVASTRPETLLGDTAIAVNPEDERYKHLIGKKVLIPIVNREVFIIGDEYIKPSFGTGCVKITPAHDPNDFEIGKKHNLPFINIFNKDGSIEYESLSLPKEEARGYILKELEKANLLVKVEDYKHTVPYSDRGKVPIEYLVSTQWFVKVEPLAKETLELLDKGEPLFIPDKWGNVYREWLVNLKDWCISRQLWWGHQIPVYYPVINGEVTEDSSYVIAQSLEEAKDKLKVIYGEDIEVQQDLDVLDTWFSSGLWPFSTLGWPNDSEDMNKYYPTSTLVTGFDIIFFWVARMTLLGVGLTRKMPFKEVFIHGLVRDENGKKMSKSQGNGIDPLLLIEKYGTDSLRYALVKEAIGAGQDINLEYNRVTDESISIETSRNFINKLWNASRFVLMNIEIYEPIDYIEDNTFWELSDYWILSKYHQTLKDTSEFIENYNLGEAARGLYEFIWNDLCDWYIELSKERLSDTVVQQVLTYLLTGILKLIHPFIPHVTEEIWHNLSDSYIALQSYPIVDEQWINPEVESNFQLVIGVIRTIRNLRAEAGIHPGRSVDIILQCNEEKDILLNSESYIKDLAKVGDLDIITPDSDKEYSQTLIGLTGGIQVLLPLGDLINVDELTNKLDTKLSKLESKAKSLFSRLNNSGFLAKAPIDVLRISQGNLDELNTQIDILKERLVQLKGK